MNFQPELIGSQLRLRPLRDDDFDALHAAASDPLIWDQHPDPLRWQRERFTRDFFEGAVQSEGAFVAIDRSDDSVVGSSRYYDWNAAQREVAIGYTFLTRSHWGGRYNAEMKRLMLDHAFRWAERIWLHVGEGNLRSRKAVEKLGAKLIDDRPVPVNGIDLPYCYYRIDRTAWEQGRAER